MINNLLDSPRNIKRVVALLYDTLSIPAAIYAALSLRYGTLIPPTNSGTYTAILLTTIVTVILFIKLGLYRAVVRFMTVRAFTTLAVGVAISATIFGTLAFLTNATIPRSSILIYLFTAYALLGTPRLFVRSIVSQLDRITAEPVVIYGAGKQGIALAQSLAGSSSFRVSTFVDDDKTKQRTHIRGLKVISPETLDHFCEATGVKKVLLALGTTDPDTRKRLIERLAEKKLEILTAPSVADIISGKATIEEVKDVEVEDLLGRPTVKPDTELLKATIKNKVIAVTGAGGSIGSELCRQILKHGPKMLLLLERDEYRLYTVEQELQPLAKTDITETPIVSQLVSIQNKSRLDAIFQTHKVDTVYHAAAYKHVPMLEHNVIEGVRNNVLGTWNCAEAAIAAGVERFVLISTDKAVRPTNIMGASKRMAELILQALSSRQDSTRFCIVRFGNVLGSSGSVVPLFRRQIKAGGPVTVTHPDITRYFMTIPEASQLVMQAAAMADGGDVFVLDMGEPVRISDLARKMIKLTGLTEKVDKYGEGDIEISYSGLRPGEKLYEELLIGDNVEGTAHPRILKAHERSLSWSESLELLGKLETECSLEDVENVIDILIKAPTDYNRVNELT